MADWAVDAGLYTVETFGTNLAASSERTTVTTANVWQEFIASTSDDASVIELLISASTGNYASTKNIDVAIGAAGFETVIVDGIVLKGKSTLETLKVVLPLGIPQGSRLSARVNRTSEVSFGGRLLSGGFAKPSTFGRLELIASDIQNDPGATANTKGAWQEVVASAANNYKGILVTTGFANGMTSLNRLVDIGVGAAASEVVISPDNYTRSNTSEAVGLSFQTGVSIAAGDRIAVRSQCSGTDAGDRITTLALYGYA